MDYSYLDSPHIYYLLYTSYYSLNTMEMDYLAQDMLDNLPPDYFSLIPFHPPYHYHLLLSHYHLYLLNIYCLCIMALPHPHHSLLLNNLCLLSYICRLQSLGSDYLYNYYYLDKAGYIQSLLDNLYHSHNSLHCYSYILVASLIENNSYYLHKPSLTSHHLYMPLFSVYHYYRIHI